MAVVATKGGGHVWGVYSMSGIMFEIAVEDVDVPTARLHAHLYRREEGL